MYEDYAKETMRGLTIRDAVRSDIRPIAEMHVAAWKVAYAPILTQEHLDWVSVEREVRRTRQMIKDNSPILVAEQDNEIVGFIAFGEDDDEDSDLKRTQHISSFWVHHERTRQGIGARLLKEMTRRTSPGRITVWVLTGVDAGPSFYEKHGFKPEEETRQDFIFLGEHMPMVRYCKTLRKKRAVRKKNS